MPGAEAREDSTRARTGLEPVAGDGLLSARERDIRGGRASLAAWRRLMFSSCLPEWPWPRMSIVTTLCARESSGMFRSKNLWFIVQPWTRKIGAPSPRSV